MGDEIYKRIIKTAEDKRVQALTRGRDPNEDREVYWFIYPGKFDEDFEEMLTDLEIGIMRDFDELVCVRRMPCEIRNMEGYDFLGECIYKK